MHEQEWNYGWLEPTPMHVDEFVSTMVTRTTYPPELVSSLKNPAPPLEGFAESVLKGLLEDGTDPTTIPTYLMCVDAHYDAFCASCKSTNVPGILSAFPTPNEPQVLELVTLSLLLSGRPTNMEPLFAVVPVRHRAAINTALCEVVLGSPEQLSSASAHVLLERAMEVSSFDALHFLVVRGAIDAGMYHEVLDYCAKNTNPGDGAAMAVLVGRLVGTPVAAKYHNVLQQSFRGALQLSVAHSVSVLTQFAKAHIVQFLVPNVIHYLVTKAFTDTRYVGPLALLATQHKDLAKALATHAECLPYLRKCGAQALPLVEAIHTELPDIGPMIEFLTSVPDSREVLAEVLRAGASLRLETLPQWLFQDLIPTETRALLHIFLESFPAPASPFVLLTMPEFYPFVEMFKVEYMEKVMRSHTQQLCYGFEDYSEGVLALAGASEECRVHLTKVFLEVLLPFQESSYQAFLILRWESAGPTVLRNVKAWYRHKPTKASKSHVTSKEQQDALDKAASPSGQAYGLTVLAAVNQRSKSPTRYSALRYVYSLAYPPQYSSIPPVTVYQLPPSIVWNSILWPELEARDTLQELERTVIQSLMQDERKCRGLAFVSCEALSFVLKEGAPDTDFEDEIQILNRLASQGGTHAEIARAHAESLQAGDVLWLSRLARAGYSVALGLEAMANSDAEVPLSAECARTNRAASLSTDVVSHSDEMLRGPVDVVPVWLEWTAWGAREMLQETSFVTYCDLLRQQIMEEEHIGYSSILLGRRDTQLVVNCVAKIGLEEELNQLRVKLSAERNLRLDLAARVEKLEHVENVVSTLENQMAERNAEIANLNALLATADKEMVRAQGEAVYRQNMCETSNAELCATQKQLKQQEKLAKNAVDMYDAERTAFEASKFENKKMQREMDAMSIIASRDRGCIKALLKYGLFMVQDAEDESRTQLERQYFDEVLPRLAALMKVYYVSVDCGTMGQGSDAAVQTVCKDIAEADVFTARSFLEALSRGQHVSAFRSYTAFMSQVPSEHAWVGQLFRRVPPAKVVSAKLFRVVWPVRGSQRPSVKDYTTEVVCELSVDPVGYVIPSVLSVREGKVIDVAFTVDIGNLMQLLSDEGSDASRPHTAAARAMGWEEDTGDVTLDAGSRDAAIYGRSVPRIRHAVQSAKMYQTT